MNYRAGGFQIPQVCRTTEPRTTWTQVATTAKGTLPSSHSISIREPGDRQQLFAWLASLENCYKLHGLRFCRTVWLGLVELALEAPLHPFASLYFLQIDDATTAWFDENR